MCDMSGHICTERAPRSNFLPSLSMSLIVKMSSKRTLEVFEDILSSF